MTKSVNERELALEVLLEIEKGEKSHLILRQVLEKYQYLSKQERAFLTRLVEGTTERRLELDYVIDQFSKTPVKKMKPVIRNAIRMAVYQLLYMDHVPESAACNESVKLVVKRGFSGLRGFVNGVVRNVARKKDSILYPDPADFVKYCSVKWSMPEWIVEMWKEQYGEEKTIQILENLYLEKPTTIRVNENKISREELQQKIAATAKAEEHPLLASALFVSDYDYLAVLPGFAEGEFQVQDASSIMVAESAQIQKGDYVIDVCAAPGGKALHAAQILDGTGTVEARDLTAQKVQIIEENIGRMGFENVVAVQQDATVLDKNAEGKADVLIADVPCSGFGVLGKKTDLKYNIKKTQINELEQLQRKILNTVCHYVKLGGTLMYSTCTINRGENEENVAAFLADHSDFELQWEKQIFPSEISDGFYIAKIRRKSEC